MILRGSLLGSALVASASMRPGLAVGDRILIDRSAYALRLPFGGPVLLDRRAPTRGEVVVFAYPHPDGSAFAGRSLVKRVVAVAGDRVRMRRARLDIAGVAVGRVAEAAPVACGDETAAVCEQAIECLGDLSWRTLHRAGDDRGATAGRGRWSLPPDWPPRIFDPMRVRASARLFAPPANRDWPWFTVPTGYLLVLGDNRDASEDSRHFGLVPLANVEGRALGIWYAAAPAGGTDWTRLGTLIHRGEERQPRCALASKR